MRSTVYIFKRHNLGLISAILLAAVATVVSCRAGTTPLANPPTLSPSPSVTSTPTLQPTPSPTDTIETPTLRTSPPEAPCLSGGSMEERAREALANWLGVSSEEIEVIEVKEVEWPDTSLGCPQPGMAYLQIIVPGWRVVMRVDDEVYDYHAGRGHAVLCDDEDHLLQPIIPKWPPDVKDRTPWQPVDLNPTVIIP